MNTPKRKAGNGEGTISAHPDGKRFRAVISLGIVDGRRKRQAGPWRDTKKEAQKDRRTMLHDRDAGRPVANLRQTVEDFLRRWLEDVARPTVRYSSYRAYKARLESIMPIIGHVKLVKLRPEDVQTLFAALADSGYSDHAVHNIRNALVMALNIAVEWQLVPYNVAKLTKIAKIEDIPRPVLSPAQVQQLLRAALGTRIDVAVHLGLLGLRSGEVCALRWQDVDWESAKLSVRGTRVHAPGGFIIGPTKTPRSMRSVPLPEQVLTVLRDWRDNGQARQRHWAGARWQETGAILTSSSGRAMDQPTLRQEFHAVLRDADLPLMRFHDLRHSCASLLDAAGVSLKTRMTLLGHAEVTTALFYTHPGDAETVAAAVALGRMMDRETTK